MYKVVTKGSINEVWATGFYNTEKPQKMIDEGYFHKVMYKEGREKVLIVVEQK